MGSDRVCYDCKSIVSGWDFEKNTAIDILSEKENSDTSVHWHCSCCGSSYIAPIKERNDYNCSKCKDKRIFNIVSLETWKRKQFIKNILFSLLSSFLASLVSAVTVKLEVFDDQWVHTTIFMFIVFLCSYNIAFIAKKIRLNNSKQFVRHRSVLYNLCKRTSGNKETTKEDFYNSIKRRLLFLMKENPNITTDRTEFLDGVRFGGKKYDTKDFIDGWVDKPNQNEFKRLLKIYQDTTYFDKLFGAYESKEMVRFSNDQNIILLLISIAVTALTTFLSIYGSIGDWARFVGKIIPTMFLCLVVLLVEIFLVYKVQEKQQIGKVLFNIIFLNSTLCVTNVKSNLQYTPKS